MSEDVKISQRYREMGMEEPPRALDDAILAAARRSARPWTKRWAVPLSLAAVIVLSVTVTLRIQHQPPGIESPVPQAAAPATEGEAAKVVVQEAAKKAVKEIAIPATSNEARLSRRESADQPAASASAPPAVPGTPEPRPFAADQAVAAAKSGEFSGAASSLAGKLSKPIEERSALQSITPERELEGIAELRRQARHDEADKALAEFRKRHPDYRISELMRERVERR